MVADAKERTDARPTSSLIGGRGFRHPLLLIATDTNNAPRRFGAFRRLIRRALSSPVESPRRSELAIRVLEELEALELDDDSVRNFRNEWLHEMGRNTRNAYLLEAFAMVQLAMSDLALAHGAWQVAPTSLGNYGLPRLVLAETASASAPPKLLVPASVAETLLKCIDLAMEAERDAKLSTWSTRDCLAVIRAIAVLSVNDTQHFPLRAEAARKQFFESVGMGLWIALTKHLRQRRDAMECATLWNGRLQQIVALNVFGGDQIAAMASTAQGAFSTIDGSADATQTAHVLRVVHGPINPGNCKEDREVIKQYEPLLGYLPVAHMPPLHHVEEILIAMRAEFPWADAAIDELGVLLQSRCLFGAQQLQLPPVLVVGFPGSGKTRFVRRIAELLKLPFLPLGIGGMHDSKPITGTPRGWASGEPSPLLNLMLRHQSASGLVLLDELDKVTSRTSNSAPITSVLLGLLESESAKRWHDTFLQTTCDMTRLSFWATANGLGNIPRPLLSRFIIVYMPEPRREHMPVLARGVVEDIRIEWGLPAGVLPIPPSSVYSNARLNAREVRRMVTRFLYEWGQEHRRPERLH